MCIIKNDIGFVVGVLCRFTKSDASAATPKLPPLVGRRGRAPTANTLYKLPKGKILGRGF